MTERGAGPPPRWQGDALIALLVIAFYANALWCGFIRDDLYQIVENPHARLSPPWHVFTVDLWQGAGDAIGETVRTGAYRPVFLLTGAVQMAIHGPNPALFHLVNVLLHLVVCLLLLRAAERLGASPRSALIGAAIFAVMPIHTEAVTGIVGRSELLAAIGTLAATLTWLGRGVGPPSGKRIIGTCLWILLALGSKESAIATPVLIALADIQRRDGLAARAKNWAWLLLPLVFYFNARWWVYGDPFHRSYPDPLDNPLIVYTFTDRMFAAPALLGKYLQLSLWPIGLSSDYSYNALPVVPPPLGLLVWTIAIALAWALCLAFVPAWRRELLVGLVAFGATIALLLNWPLLSMTLLGERLFYLPSVFLCVWLGALLSALWARQRLLGLLLVSLLLMLGGLRTAARNLDWQSIFRLAQEDMVTMPNSARLRGMYAVRALETGQAARARGEAETARQLFESALAAGDEAVRIYPQYQHAHMIRIEALMQMEQWQLARMALETAREHLGEVDIERYEERIEERSGIINE